jgi:hypothetical protein
VITSGAIDVRTWVVKREDFARWIERYELAWRTPGTASLGDLFASTATYAAAPFDAPLRGLGPIADFWEAERESAEEAFALTSELVAVEGAVGVARVEVRYGNPPADIYRDLWIIALDDGGRCIAFEEWPFFPGQPQTSDSG